MIQLAAIVALGLTLPDDPSFPDGYEGLRWCQGDMVGRIEAGRDLLPHAGHREPLQLALDRAVRLEGQLAEAVEATDVDPSIRARGDAAFDEALAGWRSMSRRVRVDRWVHWYANVDPRPECLALIDETH